MADIGQLLSQLLPFLGAGASGFSQGLDQGQAFRSREQEMEERRRAGQRADEELGFARAASQRAAAQEGRAALEFDAESILRQFRQRLTPPSTAAAVGEDLGIDPREIAGIPLAVTLPRAPSLGNRQFRRELEGLKADAAAARARITANIQGIIKDAELRSSEITRLRGIQIGLESARTRIAGDLLMSDAEKEARAREIDTSLADVANSLSALVGPATRAKDRLSGVADRQAGTAPRPPTAPGDLSPEALEALSRQIAETLGN